MFCCVSEYSILGAIAELVSRGALCNKEVGEGTSSSGSHFVGAGSSAQQAKATPATRSSRQNPPASAPSFDIRHRPPSQPRPRQIGLQRHLEDFIRPSSLLSRPPSTRQLHRSNGSSTSGMGQGSSTCLRQLNPRQANSHLQPRDDVYGAYDPSYMQPDGANQHTQSPIVTGTSVVAIKYSEGVVIAADNLGKSPSPFPFPQGLPNIHVQPPTAPSPASQTSSASCPSTTPPSSASAATSPTSST